jgi:hypothetical protein
MQRYNILVGCDQEYFSTWGVPLLSSIKNNAPFISLHCHIVNPTQQNKLDNVDITQEYVTFSSPESKISYLQSVRFLIAAEKFAHNDCLITLDADTICTRAISQNELSKLFLNQYVLKHHKQDRWLAGFVAFNNNGLREEFKRRLFDIPVDQWTWGRDQLILNGLADDFNYMPANDWMSIGKNKNNSVFLTLKGEQKETEKYLKNYKMYTND